MKVRVLALVSSLLLPATALAGPTTDADLKQRLKTAERAVVARVVRVDPFVHRNEHGDVLIMSRVQMQVEETLKGPQTASVPVLIEGGTLNGITLRVSDMPELVPGKRAVVMLAPGRSGELVPNGRGRGILELDEQNHVKNSTLWLDDVRRAAAGVR